MVKNNSHQLVDKYFENIRRTYPQTFISDEQIRLILVHTNDEDFLKPLFHYLSLHLKSSPDIKEAGKFLFLNIDESSYDISQWIEAIFTFDKWLNENGRSTTFIKMLGYINCCNSSPENKMVKYQLKDILLEMLGTHGYVG